MAYLLSNKKSWTLDTHNMEESLKGYTEQNGPRHKCGGDYMGVYICQNWLKKTF